MKNHILQKPNSPERLVSLHFFINNYICKNVMRKKFCVYVRVRARAYACAPARACGGLCHFGFFSLHLTRGASC